MTDCRVFPHEHIPAQSIKLPPHDVGVPKIWATRLLFWQLEDSAAFEECYSNLKEGLSRLLSEIPTLAGILTPGATHDFRDISITIPDNASVEFTSRDVTGIQSLPSFDILQRTGFPTTGLTVALFPKLLLEPVTEGVPMFCARLNKLKGGVVLAYGSNHVATDGWAVSEMEKLWALHTVDVSQGVIRRHKNATPDEAIRKRLSTPIVLASEPKLNPALQIVPAEEAFMRLHRDPAAAAAAGRKGIWKIMGMLADAGEKLEPRSSTIFRFTPSKLAELKRIASSSDPAEWISTMDALVALYWSRIAHIQQQSRKGHETSTCFFYVNARARLDPPIPMAYIGNVVAPASAQVPLKELESDSNGMKAAAQCLRKANSNWTPAEFEALGKIINDLPVEKGVDVDRKLILGRHNLSYNDLSKFSSNMTDWGSPLGRVSRVRLPRGALPAGAYGVVVYPKLPDGSLEVMVGCSDSLRQSLMNDPVFKQYAEFVSVSVPPGSSYSTKLLIKTIFGLHSTMRALWRFIPGQRTALGSILLALAILTAYRRRKANRK